MQSKKALSLASLVAAVPAGILAYFMVMVFINFADNMGEKPILLVAAGMTLLCCAVLLFVPVAALVFGGRRAARKAAEADASDIDETEAVASTSKGGDADIIDDADAAVVEEEDGMDATMEFDEDL
ncbi:MAG: hypothetical protein ACKVT0_01730, partial [Planctomycetaceae bacterium]